MEAVAPKYINSLVELIANGIETLEKQQQASQAGNEDGSLPTTGTPPYPPAHGYGGAHQTSAHNVTGVGNSPAAGMIHVGSGGLIWDSIQSVEGSRRHFISLLHFIRDRRETELRRLEAESLVAKDEANEGPKRPDWGAVSIAGALSKMGV